MENKNLFDFHAPLEGLHRNLDKTPQHWFDEYASWVQKTPKKDIPFINNISSDAECMENMKGKLVCFRGMVSNQLNTEYFHSQFVTNNSKNTNKLYSGLYCNFIELDKNDTIIFDDSQTKTMQRYPMLLVSPPNQTNWMFNQTTTNHGDIIEDEKCNNEKYDNNSNNNCKNITKLVAKFYSDDTSLKICDLIDIYGVWYPSPNEKTSNNKENQSENKQESLDDELESDIHSQLPYIHVLYWKKVENSFSNTMPLPNDNLNISKFNSILDNFCENVNDIRESLIEFIASYLGNDKLVAQYILLNMISQVVNRKHGVLIGSFSLNLTGFATLSLNTNDAINKINELYSLLMPYLMQIDVTLDGMNEGRFVPCKNHETNELELNKTNNLQLLNGTSIIINQIALKTGRLNETGILNCNALSELIEKQIVNYDFKYSQLPFQTDCNILVLSEKNPLAQFQCLTNIKVLHCNDGIKEEQEQTSLMQSDKQVSQVTQEQLTQWRDYICVAKLLVERFSLPEKICKLVEQDFVDLRKKRKDVTEDDLHYRLTLLRLLNASLLKQETDESVLKQMQDLENQRFKRNQ